MFHAVQTGSARTVRLLLKNGGVDLTAVDSSKMCNTYLHLNALQGNPRVTSQLLRAGCRINVENCGGYTPTHVAAEVYNEDALRCLIGAKALVNTHNKMFHCPLYSVTRKRLSHDQERKMRMMRLLIHAGADINVRCPRKYNAPLLHQTTLQCTSEQTVELLLTYGVQLNNKDSRGYTELHWGVLGPTCNINLIKKLVNYGSNVNAITLRGNTPLHEIVRRSFCHGTSIKILVESGADLHKKNLDGLTPYQLYILNRENIEVDHKILRLILPSKLHEIKSLHKACLFHEFGNIRLLILAGADVNERDQWGLLPLYYAIIPQTTYSKLITLKLMLDYGACIKKKYKRPFYNQELNAMDLAINLRDTDSVNILLEHSAKLLELFSEIPETDILPNTYRDLFNKRPAVKRDFDNYRAHCAQELKIMKTTTVGDSLIKFYDVLKGETKKIMLYARNSQVIKGLEKSRRENKFPIYQGMLRANFDKGRERRKLVEKASVQLYEAILFAEPTHAFYENTFSYFSDQDLRKLTEYHPPI